MYKLTMLHSSPSYLSLLPLPTSPILSPHPPHSHPSPLPVQVLHTHSRQLA